MVNIADLKSAAKAYRFESDCPHQGFMMDSNSMIYTEKFNNAFWDWFDSLPLDLRKKFWYYPADLAKVYFYNKIWSNTQVN